nr:Omega transcriptional repressor protein [Streptococcus pneumoniae]
MGDKTVRVRADLHHIIKIETAKNGGNVKEVMEIRLRSKLKSVLIVHYLKILYNRSGFKIGSVDTMLYANFENNFEKAVFWYLRF